MRTLFTLTFCCFIGIVNAQIISPDTVCVNTPVHFFSGKEAIAYTWMMDSVNIIQTPGAFSTVFSGTPLGTPDYVTFNNDSGHYYSFVANYFANELVRLDYGTNPNTTPTATSVGIFGVDDLLEGVDVVLDTEAHTWYGVMANGGQLIVLNFGASLATTPTATIIDVPTMYWGVQTTVKKYNGKWYAFVADRNSSVIRFDFGTSLTGTPTVNHIPNGTDIMNPNNFVIYEQSGDWYMIATSLIAADLTLLKFGSDLTNDTPAHVPLGNPGGFLDLPRGVDILTNCNSQLICYVANETGNLIKLDFAGDINNTPIPTDLGPTGKTTINSMTEFTYHDSVNFLIAAYGDNTIYKFKVATLPVPDTTIYYDSSFIHTFTTTGIYPMTLFCDQGGLSGASAFCKDIVVIDGTGTAVSKDTTLCTGTAIILHADTVGIDLWNTGDTSSSITATTTGTYWVTTTTGSCLFKSDTTHIFYITGSDISLGNDTTICQGNSVTLTPIAGGGASYLWSTGATSPSITVNTTNTYWVTVSIAGCTGSDSVNVIVNPIPVVDLGNDTSACDGQSITIQPAGTTENHSYLWNTGSTNSSISVTISGTYTVDVTVDGCTAADTINVNFKPIPTVELGSDKIFCAGGTATLTATEPAGTTYSWSNGDTTSSITVSSAGTYSLTVTDNGCSAGDNINLVQIGIPTIYLGPDTTLCLGDRLQLPVYADTGSFLWSDGSTAPTFTVVEGGTYTVALSNICGTATDTINVSYELCDLWFPSAFTPNGDGKNDIIRPRGSLNLIDDYSLAIYNRWGEQVFQSTDIYAGWDGRFNGVMADLGTYFYMLKYKLKGKQYMLKGDFELIR